MTTHFKPRLEGRGGGGGGGKGGGGDAGRAPVEAPNSLRSRATARVIDLISEGPIVGLVDGLKSVFFDGTALQNADGTFNFQDVHLETRVGTPDQNPLSGFPAIETERPVGVEVLHDTPVVRSITNSDVDAVRITMRIPALLAVETDTGDIKPTSVRIQIEVQPDGEGWQTLRTDTISGKTNSPYERAYRLNLPGAGPWDIRVSRLTADSEKSTLENKTIWSSFTEIIDHKLVYPDSALVGVAVDAQAFGGSVPRRAYECDLLIIDVPANYDPVTRAYSGIWDGTFKLAWSNNPAWVFRDIIVNNRYGAGEFIDQAQVDKWQLYAIAQYCDELVPDGFGGTEPRFTFNGVFSNREEAVRVITALAGVFRGMAHWGSGAIYASADMPADPIKLVTPANVVGGEFTYEGASLKARHTVALVTWANPENAYEPDIEVVEDAEAIERFGYRPLEVTAVGCTSRGQAARYGKWALDSEKNESEIVNYQASFDHADLAPGDIIAIADPAYAGLRLGGRMAGAAADLKSITIDAPITIEAGEAYEVMIVLPDQTVATRPLTNGAGETDVLTFGTPLDAEPVAGAMWIVTATNAAPRNFRVVAVRETDKHLFDISAVFHDPTKYPRIEQGLTLEAPDYSAIPSGPLPTPRNPTFVEYLYLASGTTPRAAVTFSWSAAADPRVAYYQVQIMRPGLEWEAAGVTSSLSIDIAELNDGVHGFRVRAIGELGSEGPWLTVEEVYLNGLLALPGDVQNFRISVVGDIATLKWDPVNAVNLSHYVIRFTPDVVGANWGSSSALASDVTGTSYQVPAQIGTYLIKAETMQGVRSQNAALVTTTVAPINAVNVVEVLAQDPAFAGEKVSTFAQAGFLRLESGEVLADWSALTDIFTLAYGQNGVELSGEYYFDQIIDLTEIYTSRVTSDFRVVGENIQNVLGKWETLATVDALAGAEPDEWSFALEVSTTNDDPDGAPEWSGWSPFTVGDYDARAFRFRVLLAAAHPWVTPVVDRLRITVDMPDRVLAGEDLAVPEAGLRVNFTPPFKRLNGASISAQGLEAGDYYALTGKDATGFNIQFFNQGGAAVARTFDYVAKGYGRVNQ